MGTLQRWEPFRGWLDLQDNWDRWLQGGSQRKTNSMTMADWVPPVDIREDAEGVRLAVELPGLAREDVTVTVEDDCLRIDGERKFEKDEQREDYHRVERAYGKFSRSFRLPQTVDTARIAAEMHNGVMKILLPKRAEAQPKRVEVKVH